jgi:hypothetical protein
MNRVTTVASARVSRDMRVAPGLRDSKGTRSFARVALIAMNGLLSTCVVVAMWLHPPAHRADGKSLLSRHTDLTTYDTVIVSASVAVPMEPDTIPVSAANGQEKPGVGVLTLLVILLALGIAIKGIAAALKLALMAVMELLRMLAAMSVIFFFVLVILIAQLGNDTAEPAQPRTLAAQCYGVDAAMLRARGSSRARRQ